MIFVALAFSFCVCAWWMNEWMNDSQRNWEITKSLDNFNSKGMTIVTWSKTMAKNTLCCSPRNSPHSSLHTQSILFIEQKMMMMMVVVVNCVVSISFCAIVPFVLVLVYHLSFHLHWSNVFFLCLVYSVMMMDRKKMRKELHSPNQSVAIISGLFGWAQTSRTHLIPSSSSCIHDICIVLICSVFKQQQRQTKKTHNS